MVRLLSRWTQLAIDLFVMAVAFGAAFLLRFESEIPAQMFKRMLFLWPYVVSFQYLTLLAFGVHRFAWRYVGLREALRIFAAAGAAAVALLTVRLGAGFFFDILQGPAQYASIPIGVITADAVLVALGVSGVRIVRRLQTEHYESRRRGTGAGPRLPTLLIGAGQAGVMVAREIGNRPDLGITPIGFIDDDRHKIGQVVHGLKVLGSTSELKSIAAKHGAAQVLITIANAPGPAIRAIKQACDDAQLPAKIIPGIYEIVGGQVNLSRIRNVSIEDVLGRDAVTLEMDAIARDLKSRTVMVTGAGGSIGSELCRQILRFEPARLLLVEQAENALFNIHRELAANDPRLDAVLKPCIADICDAGRMEALFREHRPSIVFHAAAHKHVPMMEWNPTEAVRNNVFGTRTAADLSERFGVERFVMISTDKAVNPTSVMGASKRCAELYVQSLSARSKTRFAAVRFGNVLGSAGSVIPIFQEQIEKGGPVTVTHPDMKRYFMTIPEACQLVLQAGAMGEGGEIFILDMGEPVKIVDLARDLITLSGLTPGEDIEIAFTGLRPGEKLFEELAVDGEHVDKTRHPKIFVNKGKAPLAEAVASCLQVLKAQLDVADPGAVRLAIKAMVPEYSGVPDPTQPAAERERPHANVAAATVAAAP
jgi:FlaA1/EpsC-like NDP-sugar epimerase